MLLEDLLTEEDVEVGVFLGGDVDLVGGEIGAGTSLSRGSGFHIYD